MGVRSYEVESDGKCCIGNWKHLKKAANDAKSSHRIEDYAAAYRDLPINKPYQEEPTQHKEPNVSSKTTAITKQQSLTDCQTQEHVPKTRSGRISVPPARFEDFVRFQLDMMDFDSDFALIFFPKFFVVARHIFWYSLCHKKGLDSCHDVILCTLVSYDYVQIEIFCTSQLHQGMAHTVREVVWAATSSPCSREWENHRASTCLSYPSVCHTELGPALRYPYLFNLHSFLCQHPSLSISQSHLSLHLTSHQL